MTPLTRSRRLQAGLAGLGIVGALGASVGIGAATHTHSGQAGSASGRATSSSGGTSHQAAHPARDGRDDSHSPNGSSSGVTAPQPSPPQATSNGS